MSILCMQGLSNGGFDISIFGFVLSRRIKCYNAYMTTTHGLIALNSSTAVRLTPPGTHSGFDFTVQNPNDTGYIYVGGEGVTTSDYGYRILPNHSISFEIPPRDQLYAVASTSLNAAVISMGLESKN